MNSSLDIRRNWLANGIVADYSAEVPLTRGSLSELVDSIVSIVVSMLGGGTTEFRVRDFKGRNVGDLLISTLPSPTQDEVVFLSGESASGEMEHPEWHPFVATLGSTFLEFEGSHHIIHGCNWSRGGRISDSITNAELGRALTLRPTGFRFGLEHFRSSSVSATLGFAPAVRDSMLVDCLETRAQIAIHTENKKANAGAVFSEVPVFDAIASAVTRSSGVEIRADFERLFASK